MYTDKEEQVQGTYIKINTRINPQGLQISQIIMFDISVFTATVVNS